MMRRQIRKAMPDRSHSRLSIGRQCAMLHIARSGLYQSKAPANDNDLASMRRIGEVYFQYAPVEYDEIPHSASRRSKRRWRTSASPRFLTAKAAAQPLAA